MAQQLNQLFSFIVLIVRLRQEEKRQQEETNRVKERKRKREKYAEKVTSSLGWSARTCGGQGHAYQKYLACHLGYR